jgi:hypothetical protein
MPAFWLHCATVWKFGGLIPDGVIWIFVDLILVAALLPWGQLILLTE